MSPCQFCGFDFDQVLLGKYGCPNCEGDGLDDDERPGEDGYDYDAEVARSRITDKPPRRRKGEP